MWISNVIKSQIMRALILFFIISRCPLTCHLERSRNELRYKEWRYNLSPWWMADRVEFKCLGLRSEFEQLRTGSPEITSPPPTNPTLPETTNGKTYRLLTLQLNLIFSENMLCTMRLDTYMFQKWPCGTVYWLSTHSVRENTIIVTFFCRNCQGTTHWPVLINEYDSV